MANRVEVLIEELINEVMPAEFELVDTEYVKEGSDYYLRIFVDRKAEGEYLSLKDCQAITGIVNTMLDEKDPISENYFLEVSSPGIDRPLKNDKDLKRSIGKDVEISLYKTIDGKKKLTGKLLNFDDENIYIEDEDSKEKAIERRVMSKINLAVNF